MISVVGNDIGNGLMSIGCMIMLIPVILFLLFIAGTVIFAAFTA